MANALQVYSLIYCISDGCVNLSMSITNSFNKNSNM